MKKILKKIIKIDQVQAVWLIDGNGVHTEFDASIAGDSALKIKAESCMKEIVAELPDQYQIIGCVFERNYVICYYHDESWIIIWSKKNRPLSYLRMELDVILEENLYRKKTGFFSKIRRGIIKS